jgi:uncharacterized protein (TIGR04255 family)
MTSCLQLATMSTAKHYAKPPIREAILDFRCPVGHQDNAELDARLETLASEFSDEFPVRDPLNSASGGNRSTPHVIVLREKSGRFVWQIRRDGMLLSRLPIYKSWDEVEPLGQKLWAKYHEAIENATVVELTVRAINEIRLPAGRVALEEYFLTYPTVSDVIGEPINRFAMHVGFPIADPVGQASITMAPGKAESFGESVVLFDISASCRDEAKIQADCWAVANDLRMHRNRIFEGSITDKLREMFDA